jgi:hypothetical protein
MRNITEPDVNVLTGHYIVAMHRDDVSPGFHDGVSFGRDPPGDARSKRSSPQPFCKHALQVSDANWLGHVVIASRG